MNNENQTNENQIAVAEKPKTLRAWVESDVFKSEIAKTLPQHLTPERFIRISLTAMMKNPLLGQCSQNSLFKAMLDLSSLGLEPDGRRAHLIPYKNKQGGYDAQLIIDYKGLIELAKRSGEVKSWRAEIVCEAERENKTFSWKNGVVDHEIDWLKPRGKALAVYSHVINSNGDNDFEIMTLEDVEKIKKKSKAANYGPWVDFFDEMAKKTVMRRHSKRLTLSPDVIDAMEKDFDQIEVTQPFQGQNIMPKRASEFEYNLEPKGEPVDASFYDDTDQKENKQANVEAQQEPVKSPPNSEQNNDKKPQAVVNATVSKAEEKPEDKNAQISPANISKIMAAVSEAGGGIKLKTELTDFLKVNFNAKMLNQLKNGDTQKVIQFIEKISAKNTVIREPGDE